MNTILISIVLVISTSVLNTTFQLRDKLITIDIANKNKAINESMIYAVEIVFFAFFQSEHVNSFANIFLNP